MSLTMTLSSHRIPATPRLLVSPARPFAFGFAVHDIPMRGVEIVPGEITTIEVADGTPRAHAPDEWFESRIPAIPPVTGPLRVVGVCRGDILEIEVLGLAPNESVMDSSTLITVAVSGDTDGGVRTVQAAIPPGGVVRIPAGRAGGLLSVGPVMTRHERSGSETWKTIAARVTVRCTVARPSPG